MKIRRQSLARLAALVLAAAAPACSADTGGHSCAAPGGPVAGAADDHCTEAVTIVESECTAKGALPVEEEAAVLFGSEGDDDDCKYHVSYTVDPVCQGDDIYFTVTLTAKDGGAPQLGAEPNVEGFVTANTTHVLPNTGQDVTELGGGRYKIGPVRFDQAGEWTVRFHFYEDCADTEASPHGHVGFFINVP